jgi:hypothetical protein
MIPRGYRTLCFDFLRAGATLHFTATPQLAALPAGATAWTPADCQALARLCESNGIALIVGWLAYSKVNGGPLLLAHPEFRERTRDADCAVMCFSNPRARRALHGCVTQLIGWFTLPGRVPGYHASMDELNGLHWPALTCTNGCARGRPQAIFASAVNALDSHVRALGSRLHLWGDTLLGGYSPPRWGVAALDGVEARLSREIVLWDWHYSFTSPSGAGWNGTEFTTVSRFARQGFRVYGAAWTNLDAAAAMQRTLSRQPSNVCGYAQTTWFGSALTNLADACAGATNVPAAAAETARILNDRGRRAGVRIGGAAWTPAATNRAGGGSSKADPP